MHDPKFEKEVQRKMHDLEFVPSESVWENIQVSVAPRRRRRALAFFWWWLAPGIALLGVGVLVYHSSVMHTSAVAEAGRASKSEGSYRSDGAGTAGTGAAGVAGSGGEVQRGGSVAADGVEAGSTGSPGQVGGATTGTVQAGNAGAADQTGAAAGAVQRGNVANAAPVGKDQNGGLSGLDFTGVTNPGVVEDGNATGQGASTSSVRAAYPGYQPGLISCIAASAGVHAPRLSSQPANTATTGIPVPKHPWMAGFAAGGGASYLDGPASNALGTAYSSNSRASNFTFAAAPSNAASVKRSSSSMKPDASYWAGIFAEKPLSARWSVDIGLNLHYYSTRLYSNETLNSYISVPSSASLLTPSALTYAGTTASNSSTEQVYTNRYYFLEVPAAVQWKINRSRALPLYWRGGVVFSYLMSSNALYYDQQSGTYSKDNAVVQHVQANVTTGLMVGLPIKGVRIQAGPEIQYGVTSLETTTTGNGHLLYGGMRVALLR